MRPIYKKHYVLAPYNHATGGVELAHQLVDYLNNNKADAYIVYIDKDRIVKDADITKEYIKYNIKVSNEIEDSNDNILIIPEVSFDWIYQFRAINIGCWWMSVDFHYINCHWTDAFKFQKTAYKKFYWAVKLFIDGRKNKISWLRKQGDRITHFYQSAYAQNHLYNKGFNKIIPLKDYINNDFTEDTRDSVTREDIVLYNPAKGFKFTKKIIDSNPNVRFVALKGLTRGELLNYMRKSKIYIDFGHFPGKDRLPRESVINGLCVITGKEGASGFFEDIPLDSIYKIEAKDHNLSNISLLINDIFNNYESHTCNFRYWRNLIAQEKEEFYENIKNAFFI